MAKYLVLRELAGYITRDLENALNNGYSIVTVNPIGSNGLQYVLKKGNDNKPLTAHWMTREHKNDYLWVECSNCGFLVEIYNAVNIGKSSTDIVGYKYHACPKCTAKMIMNEQDV